MYVLEEEPCLNIRNASGLISTNILRNSSCLGHAPQLTYGAYLRAVVLLSMTLLSFLANLATIWSIKSNKRKSQNCSAIYSLILHLSVADLFVTVFCMGGEALWSYNVAWIWGNTACKAFKFLQMFSLYLSTFVLVLIGIDRFVAVKYPMKTLNTAKKCNQLISFIWFISFILSTPQVVIFHVAQGPFIEDFSQCVTHGFYTEVWQEQLYTTLSLIFMFIMPLTILITTYMSTVITIARSERLFKSELANSSSAHKTGDVNRRRLIHRAKTKSLRISVVIVVAFVLWWTPYYIMMIIFMFLNPDKHVSADMQKGIFFFGMSNSLVNPLIYGAFHLWPQKKNRKHRENSIMQLRSTTTNASLMMDHRSTNARFTKQTKYSHIQTHEGLSVNHDTVVVHLIENSEKNKFCGRAAKIILHYNLPTKSN
ncbi:gonadotropin-releasing hormone receptor isoform X2 [Nasonia vitripennis]|uniref:G-protein coupled receptors family 1 profile domain-containing protein n=1 Tax=Nasonia vitripennis TaxID=7425 RepID=A0A7M7R137_NASVI|nr:gonadotropin-releasing hormone receptor isoform X2 [Nasonia vitripennis]XP_032457740.1 gonadotropin-releasing hormone receptor isoform X2 [Nasonia vitripennis]